MYVKSKQLQLNLYLRNILNSKFLSNEAFFFVKQNIGLFVCGVSVRLRFSFIGFKYLFSFFGLVFTYSVFKTFIHHAFIRGLVFIWNLFSPCLHLWFSVYL